MKSEPKHKKYWMTKKRRSKVRTKKWIENKPNKMRMRYNNTKCTETHSHNASADDNFSLSSIHYTLIWILSSLSLPPSLSIYLSHSLSISLFRCLSFRVIFHISGCHMLQYAELDVVRSVVYASTNRYCIELIWICQNAYYTVHPLSFFSCSQFLPTPHSSSLLSSSQSSLLAIYSPVCCCCCCCCADGKRFCWNVSLLHDNFFFRFSDDSVCVCVCATILWPLRHTAHKHSLISSLEALALLPFL